MNLHQYCYTFNKSVIIYLVNLRAPEQEIDINRSTKPWHARKTKVWTFSSEYIKLREHINV
jgi:hypothetical protein